MMAQFKNGKFSYNGDNPFLKKHGWKYHGVGLWSFEDTEPMSESDAIWLQRSINRKGKPMTQKALNALEMLEASSERLNTLIGAHPRKTLGSLRHAPCPVRDLNDVGRSLYGGLDEILKYKEIIIYALKHTQPAIEKGQRAQEIVDLMEQGKDIAFVSENHGEFIYRTQHSLATQQDRTAIRDLTKDLEYAIGCLDEYTDTAGIIDDLRISLKTHSEAIKRAGGE